MPNYDDDHGDRRPSDLDPSPFMASVRERLAVMAMVTVFGAISLLMAGRPTQNWGIGAGSGAVSQCQGAQHTAGGSDGSGGCWPGVWNTGVPAGTTLTAYSGSCDITTANTTIDSKTVDCPSGVSIQAANVTIIRSQVTGLVRLDPDTAGYTASGGTWSITVTDSDINAGLIQQAALCCTNMDVLRSRLRGGQTGAQCEVGKFCRVRDSYLGERAVHTTSWHLGGFLSDGTNGASCTGVGSTGLCIELTHNTIWCDTAVNGVPDDGCSGDVQLIPNFARIDGVQITNNLFPPNIDAAYCTFGGDKSDSTWRYGHNIVYSNNIFARGTNNLCAAYGPVTDFGSDATNNPGNTWTNNRYADGTLIPAP